MTEPYGCLHTPMLALRSMLSEVAAWQTWCGVDTAEAAAARVHRMTVEIAGRETGPSAPEWPFAVVSMGPAWQSEAVGAGPAGGPYQETGDVYLAFEDAADPSETVRETLTRFMNRASAVLDGLRTLSGTGTYLNIVRMTQRATPGVFQPEKQAAAPRVQAAYLVEFGP